jgi:hypothetical protein
MPQLAVVKWCDVLYVVLHHIPAIRSMLHVTAYLDKSDVTFNSSNEKNYCEI